MVSETCRNFTTPELIGTRCVVFRRREEKKLLEFVDMAASTHRPKHKLRRRIKMILKVWIFSDSVNNFMTDSRHAHRAWMNIYLGDRWKMSRGKIEKEKRDFWTFLFSSRLFYINKYFARRSCRLGQENTWKKKHTQRLAYVYAHRANERARAISPISPLLMTARVVVDRILSESGAIRLPLMSDVTPLPLLIGVFDIIFL